MIYFTSDLHFFGDRRKGAKFVPVVGTRMFASSARRDDFLVESWNNTVQPEDVVWILGDFSEGTGAETAALLQKLNGSKNLIIGNHDKYLGQAGFDAALFGQTLPYAELKLMDTKFVLFHYPIEVWSGCKNDRVHLHGHVHSRQAVPLPIRRYDVGVDANGGTPVSLDAVWQAVQPFTNARQTKLFRGDETLQV